ncbi:hypothetical protein ACKKBG_A12170 [Auxenochlorella protothecoides x Auxenochlorella symbiontica]
MGQYLSAPITEKESGEGQTDSIAYGFAGMQGWRVAMEDAHIVDVEFDTSTKTALFSVFDGHGGRAVAHFAAKYLPGRIMATKAYAAGDLGAAVAEAYLELDQLMDAPAGQEELDQLAAPVQKTPLTLFSDVDTSATSNTSLDSGRVSAPEEEAEEAAPSAPGVDRRLRKMNSSSEFLASHLQRASIVTPRASPEGPSTALAEHGSLGRTDTRREASALAGEEGEEVAEDPASLFGILEGASVPALAAAAPAESTEQRPRAEGAGCTALTALVRGGRLVVANTGDSRAVLSRRGVAVALTLDHKPILFEEARRIIRAGGFVRDNRINGSLNVSRALGDLDFKRNAALGPHEQMVVVTPDIEVVNLSEGDEFMIMACDGIWDVLSNQEAVDYVRRRIKNGSSLQAICESMCDHCLAPDLTGMCRGADNMSVVVVLFKRTARLDGIWGRMWSGLWGSMAK